jgi:hypothetical protein
LPCPGRVPLADANTAAGRGRGRGNATGRLFRIAFLAPTRGNSSLRVAVLLAEQDPDLVGI